MTNSNASLAIRHVILYNSVICADNKGMPFARCKHFVVIVLAWLETAVYLDGDVFFTFSNNQPDRWWLII